MDLFLLIGIVGMAGILLGFVMVQTHTWTQDDVVYDLVNGIGSILLVISAVASRAWPFVILNTIWGLYSMRDVLLIDRWKWPAHGKMIRRAG